MATKFRSRIWRSPVARIGGRVRPRSSPLVARRGARPTVDVVERLVAEGVRPPQLGAFDGQPPAHLVDPGGQGVLLLVRRGPASASARSRRASSVRTVTARGSDGVEVGVEVQGGAVSAVASRHRTLSDRMRTGPVSRCRTGRQIPPGFQSGSMQSQCWKTPVRLRLARQVGRAGARHLDRQHVLACGPTGRRSPRRCGERNSPRCRPGTRRPARRRPGRRCRRR